jgi:hypothetical protein
MKGRRALRTKKRRFVLYKATNKLNGYSYIGACSWGIRFRRHNHIQAALNGAASSRYFYRAIRKYGPKSFRWQVIGRAKSQKEMMAFEIKLIAKLAPEYNITGGGEGFFNMERTARHCARISASLKGRKPSQACIDASVADRSHMFKSIVCLNDGKFFESVISAKKYYGVPAIDEVLHGRQLHTGGYSFVYSTSPLDIEDCKKRLAKLVATKKRNKGRARGHPVLCLTDGKEYVSRRVAALAYGIDYWKLLQQGKKEIQIRDLAFRVMPTRAPREGFYA